LLGYGICRLLLIIETHRLKYNREENAVSGWYTLINDEPRSSVHGNIENIQKVLKDTASGAHHLIVYPNLATLRKVYSDYINNALNEKNETVIVLPFFETTDSVRRVLGEGGMDVANHEKHHSLLIMDSLKGYFGSAERVKPLIDQALEHAKTSGKNGVSALGDMGSFFHNHKEDNDLIEHELSLPSEYDETINLKTFCLYHKLEFDKKLSQEQRERLLKHHGKNMMITAP
jgi:MEDS: MEthanogen/methylotroph, DcmR Sensory domain